MKKTATALFLLTLGTLVYAGDWNDALSSPTVTQAAELGISSGGLGTSSIASMNGAAPEPVATSPAISSPTVHAASPAAASTTGREIVIAHLKKIKSNDLMINTVTLEPYWRNVFVSAGHPELFASSQADIQVALEAGLSPYLRGQPISAEQFADDALAALHKTSTH